MSGRLIRDRALDAKLGRTTSPTPRAEVEAEFLRELVEDGDEQGARRLFGDAAVDALLAQRPHRVEG